MKWIGISGSWRLSSEKLRRDVQTSTAEVMRRGDGIVSGGALGVDQVATEEALKYSPDADHIKIIIPSNLEVFAAYYRNRADEGVISSDQAESLLGLLAVIKDKGALQEMNYAEVNVKSYYARNNEVLRASDELLAFQVNGSAGTQDTINKARELGVPVVLKRYEI